MEDKDAIIKTLPFWEHLSNDEKNIVSEKSVLRTYKKGTTIRSSDGGCLGMILTLCGEIRVYILSEEGREITLFRIRNGEACVLSASCVITQIAFETNMVAETDTEVLIIPVSVFGKLAENNIYVKCFMYELMTERFSNVIRNMQQMIFCGFDKRLAEFLLNEYERTGIKTIRMTHEQIAKELGSAREVVARMMKRFSAEGLVEVRRGAVTLKDLRKLQNI